MGLSSSSPEIIRSIPASQSDTLLRSWGYDLLGEYAAILAAASFPAGRTVLELAAGTGRMTAILVRMGHTVVAGDKHFDRLPDVRRRVTAAYESRVAFACLDMNSLPVRSGTARCVTCVNTLHELNDPLRALGELIRILHRQGTLVVTEFNQTGYDVMQHLHRQVYDDDHPRVPVSLDQIVTILRSAFASVRPLETPLNCTFIARTKMRRPAAESFPPHHASQEKTLGSANDDD